MSKLNASVEFVDYTETLQKRPIYYVKFGKIGTNAFVPPQQFATGKILKETQSRPVLMKVPEYASRTILPIAGRSTIGGVNFSLFDKDSQITLLLSNYTFKNRGVTIYAGYAEMEEQYFTIIFNGVITDIALDSGGTSYTFQVQDLQRTTKTSIFGGKSQLKTNLTSGGTTVNAKGVSGFAPSTASFGGFNYILIDEEIISYTGLVDTPLLKQFTGCTRGVTITFTDELGVVRTLGSPAVSHDTGADIFNFVKVEGNPVDIALQLICSSGLGTNNRGAGFTNYDTLFSNQGVAVDSDLVDYSAFEGQRDKLISVFKMRFFFKEAEDAKKILEDEIYRAINAYPVINADGKLSLKMYTAPLPTSNAPVIDERSTIGVPTFKANMLAGKSFFNEVNIKNDFDEVRDEFFTQNLYIDAGSQSKFQEVSIVNFEFKGIKSDILGTNLLNRLTNNIFLRYSQNPAPEVAFETFFSQQLVNEGDIVFLKSFALPDLKKGKRGQVSNLVEITSRSVNFKEGKCSFVGLLTEFAVDRKYGAITPANFPTYLSANEQQRKYAFIGNEIVVDSVAQMSNGDDGYYITGD
jgi:hypothetical protein